VFCSRGEQISSSLFIIMFMIPFSVRVYHLKVKPMNGHWSVTHASHAKYPYNVIFNKECTLKGVHSTVV
jgi:hypothetical protein